MGALSGIGLTTARVACYIVIASATLTTLFGTFCSLFEFWFFETVPWSRLTDPVAGDKYNALLRVADPSNTGSLLTYGSNNVAVSTIKLNTL